MGPKAAACLFLSLLVAGALGARDPLHAHNSRVPKPFIVNGESPASHVYFYDEGFAGYDVGCVAPDGSTNFSFTLATRGDSPGSTSNVVVFGISTQAVGNYTCKFAKSGGCGSKRVVKIAVREPNAVPDAPALSILGDARTPETFVYFPDVETATEYRVHCRTPEQDHLATSIGKMGTDTTSFVTVTVTTKKPSLYGCVIYAKNARGDDGMSSYIEFVVTA